MTGYQRISRSAIGATALCALFGPPAVPGSGPRLLGPAAAQGQIVVVDHQPHPFGGPAADTLYANPMTGQTAWQLLADNFTLSRPTFLSRVEWWGCYGGFQQSHQPPPGDETMRVRFYDSRPGDGLPGDIVYEESFLNPSRTATGANVGSCGPEFFFQADFASAIQVQANTQYWLEIVQVGDVASHFRWEFSLSGSVDLVFKNPTGPDWQYASSFSDLAFQLHAVPEPMTAIGVCAFLAPMLRRRRRMLKVKQGQGAGVG